MKLMIDKCEDYYISIYPGNNIDEEVAKILDIPIEEYNQILIDNGAHIMFYCNDKTEIGYEFKRKRDVQKVIEILEPYLVMKKLTE